MALTLIRNAAVVATLDDVGTEIAGGAVAMRDGVILAVGTTAELAPLAGHADVITEAAGCMVMPGLVNTHHHLYQTLTRALSGATEASLFAELGPLLPVSERRDAGRHDRCRRGHRVAFPRNARQHERG